MNEYDEARVRVLMELITEGHHESLFSASIAEAGGDTVAARGIYFQRRVDEVLKSGRNT
jgi:hypothetical protein